jgi:hypothetical protein
LKLGSVDLEFEDKMKEAVVKFEMLISRGEIVD